MYLFSADVGDTVAHCCDGNKLPRALEYTQGHPTATARLRCVAQQREKEWEAVLSLSVLDVGRHGVVIVSVGIGGGQIL